MKYFDEIYNDKNKKYYKRFKAIKKGKRQPSDKDFIYIANILKITKYEARKEKLMIYAMDIDKLIQN